MIIMLPEIILIIYKHSTYNNIINHSQISHLFHTSSNDNNLWYHLINRDYQDQLSRYYCNTLYNNNYQYRNMYKLFTHYISIDLSYRLNSIHKIDILYVPFKIYVTFNDVFQHFTHVISLDISSVLHYNSIYNLCLPNMKRL